MDQRPLALPKIKLLHSLCPCSLTHSAQDRDKMKHCRKSLALGFCHGQPRGVVPVIIRMGRRPTGSLGGVELQNVGPVDAFVQVRSETHRAPLYEAGLSVFCCTTY